MTFLPPRAPVVLPQITSMIKKIFILLLMVVPSVTSIAQQIHVNVKTGDDTNTGTLAQPLKTLAEAAHRVNAETNAIPATVFIAEGVYPLNETVLFNNNKFTLQNRLIIRAEVLPDDADWTPQRMPVITSVIPGVAVPKDGEQAIGLQIEVNHASIEGLRFTGSPAYYYIDGKQNRRYYPVWRGGKTLDDLLVSQCVFIGDPDIMPIRVAVIANGHGLVVDHCVFYNCQNSIVFWAAEGGTSYHNAMRYCLVYSGNYSGVWTTDNTGDDFDFHNNIIANGRSAWVTDKGTRHYKASNSIFANNNYVMRYGNDTNIADAEAGNDLLKTTDVKLSGNIEIEKDQGKNNYLQLKTGSLGFDLHAGLFKK